MKKSVYFKLQLKRALKIYPAIFIITAITIACIAVSCCVLLNNSNEGEDKQKVSVGIVGDIDKTYLGIGMYALENIDSSRFFIDFPEMDSEEEAIKALKNREISGYVYIPADFIQGIFYGRNTPAKYVMLSSADGFGSVLTSEITQVVSGMVTESQNGIYSMQQLAGDYGKKAGLSKHIDALNIEYLKMVLNRNSSYNLNILGIADTLSTGGYYLCGILLFFLLIWGISCNKLLASKNLSLARSLNASGMKPVHQMVCEYSAFLVVTFFTLQLLAVIFGFVVTDNSFGVPELVSAGVSSSVAFVFKMLPVIIMITMMHTAFYELVSGPISSVLVQFLIAIGLGYISGCFYPNYFFPDTVQKIAAILPSGTGFSYLRKLLSDTLELKDFILPVIYTLLFGMTALFARKRRMAGDGK